MTVSKGAGLGEHARLGRCAALEHSASPYPPFHPVPTSQDVSDGILLTLSALDLNNNCGKLARISPARRSCLERLKHSVKRRRDASFDLNAWKRSIDQTKAECLGERSAGLTSAAQMERRIYVGN
jgi:hypothetical protein